MPPACVVAHQVPVGGKQLLHLEEEEEHIPEPAKGKWFVQASEACLRTTNPIRALTDSIKALPKSGKEVISLSIGDPTVFGNLEPPQEAITALVTAIQSSKFNGYTNSTGLPECRNAVAKYHNSRFLKPLKSEDVFITVGCTQAIQLCIAILANPGVNILLPRPGFSPYQSFCEYYGVEARFYDLVPAKGWTVDLEMVKKIKDDKTVAILICNPGNPSGAVFSRQHLSEIAEAAEDLRLPIIADEIYADMVFGDTEFFPMASVASRVPILTAGGLSKRWLVPGWRLGWILASDHQDTLAKGQVISALNQMMQTNIGTSTIVQAAVPSILNDTPKEFFERTTSHLEAGARYVWQRVRATPGLDCPSQPEGSMFAMIRMQEAAFAGISSDVEFASKLLEEEAVIVLPGVVFGLAGWFRVVYVAPLHVLEKAFDRIEAFCHRYYLGSLKTCMANGNEKYCSNSNGL